MILWKISRQFLAWYTLLVDDLEFTTPCWSATSSLLHLNHFRGGGGGKAPLAPPQYANASWCVFIIFCIKIALVTYWGPHRIIFGPPPQGLEKKWTVFKLKFGLQILIFSDTAKCWREDCSEGWFCPPPFHTKKWLMQFKLFLFITTFINDAP